MKKKRVLSQEIVLAIFILFLSLFFTVVSKGQFATFSNCCVILSQMAINGICVIGLTFCVIMGGIDFSAGAILATTACFSGLLVNAGVPVPLVLIISILIGTLSGALNGFMIGRLAITPIIATLASMYILRGITTIFTGGIWVSNFPDRFKWPGQTYIAGIPMHFVLFILLAAAVQYVFSNCNIGRKLYACGGNPEAAKLFGLNYNKYRFCVYTISGAFIGLAGLIYASMVGTVSADTTGLNTSNDLLAAALIGGVNINGGKGSIVGACLGVLLMQIIRNGLIICRFAEHWADAATGLIIVIALVLNVLEKYESQREGDRV